jgi:hypothetical protein
MAMTLAHTVPSTLVRVAESTSHEAEGVNPYLVGAGTLALLLALLFVVVVIGGGREHS